MYINKNSSSGYMNQNENEGQNQRRKEYKHTRCRFSKITLRTTSLGYKREYLYEQLRIVQKAETLPPPAPTLH